MPHLRKIDLSVVEVVLRILADQSAVGVSQLAAELRRNPGPESARRHDGVFRKDCPGGNDGTLADAAVIQDSDAHPDEDVVFDHAAVDCGVVADRDPVSDNDRIEVALAMEDGTVLNIGICPYTDGVDIATKDGIHPDRGVLAEDHISKDLCRNVDVAGFGNLRSLSLVTADHRDQPLQ